MGGRFIVWCLHSRAGSLPHWIYGVPKIPCGNEPARERVDAVSDQVRIPRPLTSNRAQPKYSTTVATSIKVIAMPILISDTPKMP